MIANQNLDKSARSDGSTPQKTEAQATRDELDTVLDSILQSPNVAPGTPFEERIGKVETPELLEMMREIDDIAGGRIEWPDVYASKLQQPERGVMVGLYTPEGESERKLPGFESGIHISEELLDKSFSGDRQHNAHPRAVLVHELQHALTDQHRDNLLNPEYDTDVYKFKDEPYSETRADAAMLVFAELRIKSELGGPKLNELNDQDRRDAMAEVLTPYLTTQQGRGTGNEQLLTALKDDNYLHEMSPNAIWRQNTDEKSTQFLRGALPDHKIDTPGHMSFDERLEQLAKPLDQLANEYRARPEHRERDAPDTPGRAGPGTLPPTSAQGPEAPTEPTRPHPSATQRSAEPPDRTAEPPIPQGWTRNPNADSSRTPQAAGPSATNERSEEPRAGAPPPPQNQAGAADAPKKAADSPEGERSQGPSASAHQDENRPKAAKVFLDSFKQGFATAFAAATITLGAAPAAMAHEAPQHPGPAPAHTTQAQGQQDERTRLRIEIFPGEDTIDILGMGRSEPREISKEAYNHERDTVLDAMLQSPNVAPGTPFEERIGKVESPELLEMMREIDEITGGRIQWPDVHISQMPDLGDATPTALYSPIGDSVTKQAGFETGIHISGDFLEKTLSGDMSDGHHPRNVLVHELQHALTDQHRENLLDAARDTESYGLPTAPMSEARADAAMILFEELEARKDLGGPKLNELSIEERRDATAELLTPYLTTQNGREVGTRELVMVLKDTEYLSSEWASNTWRKNADDKTRQFMAGVLPETEINQPAGMTVEERSEHLQKTLPELASDYRARPEQRREYTPESPTRSNAPTPEVSSSPTAGSRNEAPPEPAPPTPGTTGERRPTPDRGAPAEPRGTAAGSTSPDAQSRPSPAPSPSSTTPGPPSATSPPDAPGRGEPAATRTDTKQSEPRSTDRNGIANGSEESRRDRTDATASPPGSKAPTSNRTGAMLRAFRNRATGAEPAETARGAGTEQPGDRAAQTSGPAGRSKSASDRGSHTATTPDHRTTATGPQVQHNGRTYQLKPAVFDSPSRSGSPSPATTGPVRGADRAVHRTSGSERSAPSQSR